MIISIVLAGLVRSAQGALIIAASRLEKFYLRAAEFTSAAPFHQPRRSHLFEARVRIAVRFANQIRK